MKYTNEVNTFINAYVKAIKENNAVIFAGAGLSVDVGFFDWQKLLEPIAKQLDLDIEEEKHDLSSLAQFFVDSNGSRGTITQILKDRYAEPDVKLSEKHRILARLPIQLYWTTNFDNLIEQALREAGKTPDVKMTQANLLVNQPKRDAIVYKMHGDISLADDTVLTKHEYEDYNKTRELFSTTFKSDFVARTFLFIGFSFSDPNLDYLIGRIRSTVGNNVKPDYYFIKKEANERKHRKQKLRANTLQKYGLIPVWIDDFPEIEVILKEIEVRFLRSVVFISGSAETYAPLDKSDAEKFLHNLSYSISNNGYKILTGFGLGVGSSVINGVLDNMQTRRNQNLDNYIIMRPFPQIQTGSKPLPELWNEYRETFIPLAGIAIFVFGNKNGGSVLADGLEKEFDIAVKRGLKVIPIGATGYMSKILWEKVMKNFESFYPEHVSLKSQFEALGNSAVSIEEHIKTVVEIINTLNKN